MMSRGKAASGVWILLGVEPDGRQIENQRAYFIAYEQGFVRKRLSRDFGSETNI